MAKPCRTQVILVNTALDGRRARPGLRQVWNSLLLSGFREHADLMRGRVRSDGPAAEAEEALHGEKNWTSLCAGQP